MFHRKSRACSSRNTDAEFGHCEYKVAPRAMHWEAAHSTPEKKNIAKTWKKHLLPHKRIKCTVHLLYGFLKSWMWWRSGNGEKDGHFVGEGQHSHAQRVENFESQFQELKSHIARWAEPPETHRLHFQLKMSKTWLRAHLQEERSCCKIENLTLLQSHSVSICFCPIDIQIYCSVPGKQATRHTATVRESLPTLQWIW